MLLATVIHLKRKKLNVLNQGSLMGIKLNWVGLLDLQDNLKIQPLDADNNKKASTRKA